MPKRVIDVGQCNPDHGSLRQLIEGNFAAQVVRTHGLEDTLSELRAGGADLVLINRKLDRDYTDGIDILKVIKADSDLAEIPVMLITNYEEHQQLAVEAGAVTGFGKSSLGTAETRERLAEILG